MAAQDWSAIDIRKARDYFLRGMRIKDIARELGRSTTATNKALSRFGIRFEKPRRNYTESPIEPRSAVADRPIAPPSFERKSLRRELDNWVSFWRICEYLGEHNVCLYELSAPTTELEQRRFKVDTKILNARQLLVMANKIRSENNFRPFFVKGLSW